MLFNFRLTPVDAVVPWSRDNHPVLHWFALTDGCYWLRVGEAELFRYSQSLLNTRDDHSGCEPYVDYPVVRLWEDIFEILPTILNPVPEVLREKLAASNLENWYQRIFRWSDENEQRSYEIDADAAEWLRKRHLPTGYLKQGPNIWFWNDGTHIHLEWDNRERKVNGGPVWEAEIGTWSLLLDEFLAEIRTFDAALVQAMQGRVEQIMVGWNRPEISLDKDRLVAEQAYRSTLLEDSLRGAFQQPTENWDAILEAVNIIQTDEIS